MKIMLIIPAILLMILTQSSNAQGIRHEQDVYTRYFEEILDACKKSEILWGKNLYGPMLLVDQETREVIASHVDSLGELTHKGGVFTGKLSDKVSIANTSIKWNGTKWAMVVLPLPEEQDKRIRLLAHELFHRSQSDLKFTLRETDNSHLDQKQARIYLRLEMQALKEALMSPNDTTEEIHLTNALVFRILRNTLYPHAAINENFLELNEGLAEFTALVVAGQPSSQRKVLSDAITEFISKPSYVRSFAYCTIPAYGFFLYQRNKLWTRTITSQTNLTATIITNLGLKLPDNPKNLRIAELYGLVQIDKQESEREHAIEAKKRLYRSKFLDSPHFVIKTEAMNISFDPASLVSMENDGTVYPNLKIIDNWGILTVKNGALISPNWDMVRVSEPTELKPTVAGDGWTLELAEGYIISKQPDGVYQLVKK